MVELQEIIDKTPWTKTNYHGEHEYITKKQNYHLFNLICNMIIERGYYKNFNGINYKYIDLNGYKYWIVDICLNRAKTKNERLI